MDYYETRQEGHREAWDHTAQGRREDFDTMVAVAAQQAKARDRNYVVRHVQRGTSQVICTAEAGTGTVVWPRQASPPVPVG